jgi:cold shock CspA family protein
VVVAGGRQQQTATRVGTCDYLFIISKTKISNRINMSDPKSMGEAFMQRRAAMAAANKSDRNSTATVSTTTIAAAAAAAGGSRVDSTNMSMAEIQREQLLQREQQQRPQRRPQVQQQRQHPVDEYGRLIRTPSGGNNANANDADAGEGDYNASNTSQGHRRGNNYNSSSSNSARYSSSRGSTSNNYRKNLPIEQGIIHSLLDKFGFILCADRDRQLFFHYSEYNNGNRSADELNIGDEVEFRIGGSPPPRGGGGSTSRSNIDVDDEGNEKLCALDVQMLPPGTIFWETEDEPRGKRWMGVVEKVAATGNSSRRRRVEDIRSGDDSGIVGGIPLSSPGGAGAGMIRIISDDSNDAENDETKPLGVYYNLIDVAQTSTQQRRPRRPQLECGDIVEFTLVTERRTKQKYAREIYLIRSERERLREEEEKRLLENATLETGVVVSIQGDFGFLRSTSRVQEVYFHTSHAILSVEGDKDGGCEHIGEGGGGAGSYAPLKEGQDVEFYVVNEVKSSEGGKKGRNGKLSARQVKILPKGTVKFEHIIAQGVSGSVTESPLNKVIEPFGRSERGGGESVVGKIRLQEDVFDNDGNCITEVSLRPEVYPGGTFAMNRTGSEVGTWIRPGDVLLFDVVKKVVDGTCHAVPTKIVRRSSLRPGGCTDIIDSTTNLPPSIRLIEPSLCGRTEGVVRSIHDNYGFIQLAERNADAYFPLYEVFPAEILGDLVRNNPDIYSEGDESIQQKGDRIHDVEVGMEVAFDLSLQMLTNLNGGRDGGGRFKQSRPIQDKQSLRARRVQILPQGTVREKISIASGVQATVTKVDAKQIFVGTLELDEPVKIESVTQHRHPLVARLIDSISNGNFGTSVTFHDVLSETDSQIATSMVNARDDLEWSYVIPENSTEDIHNRRICIARKHPVVAPHTAVLTSCDDASMTPANEVKAVEGETDGEAVGDGNFRNMEKKQDLQRMPKVVKSVRYDKVSFPDMSDGPLCVGDVVKGDVYLSRRAGTINIDNVTVVERKVAVVSDSDEGMEHAVKRTSLRGFVSEVVPSRQFGFITAVDGLGTKTGDHIFFHFKEVESCSDISSDQSPIKSKKFGRSDIISKGNEVMFDSGLGNNGKLNATNITILPRGTLKQFKADLSSTTCTGYILIEPSRTLLLNTPSHSGFQSAGGQGAGVGRWTNVRDEPTNKVGTSMKGEGVILLLTDPSNQFSPKPNSNSPSIATISENKAFTADSVLEAYVASEAGNINASVEIESENDNINSNASVVGTHIGYKFSSLAARSQSTDVNAGRSDGPKRGDLVSFSKVKGSNLVKDIRITQQGAATRVTGTLISVDKEADSAIFVSAEPEMKYDIKLTEVVSCDKALINENEKVDGIMHEGRIFGGKMGAATTCRVVSSFTH